MKAAIAISDRSPTRNSLARAALCSFLSRAERTTQTDPASILRARFPGDNAALAILGETRAAVAGAVTTTAGWASEIVGQAVGEFISSLPSSAAAKLILQGMQVAFPAGMGSVKIPMRAAGPTAASWIAEGAEIPARSWVLSGIPLAPKKVGVLLAFSQELANHSFAETIFKQMLQEEATLSIDAAYFSTNAATSAGLAGLLWNVTPTVLSGTAGGAPGDIVRDLGALAAAANAGPSASGEITFVVAPSLAAQLMTSVSYLNLPGTPSVFASAAIPDNRVIAIDPRSVAHGFGDVAIDSSVHSTLHLSDAPAAIGTAGSPNVVAAPSASLFQTAMISLRMLIDLAFVKRRSGCVQYADRDWSP